MIFSREYIGYLARRTVKHLVDVKLITTSNLKGTEERVTHGLVEELSLEDRINEEVRVILDAYSDEMRKSGAQYAEMFKKVKNELARSNAYYGAWALNTNAPELPVAAAAARIAASEAYWYAAKENIQTHGGIGFTWEVDCHLFYRRSRQLALVAGAPRAWKERLVSQLERKNAA